MWQQSLKTSVFTVTYQVWDPNKTLVPLSHLILWLQMLGQIRSISSVHNKNGKRVLITGIPCVRWMHVESHALGMAIIAIPHCTLVWWCWYTIEYLEMVDKALAFQASDSHSTQRMAKLDTLFSLVKYSCPYVHKQWHSGIYPMNHPFQFTWVP